MKARLAIAAAVLLPLGAVAGCGQDGPFSLTVSEVNESPPQRNAVIALSDPQIYTRERLLNDREEEIKYLRKQLSEIDTKNFAPRLKRDLDMLVELAAALSVKFNPIAGAEITQSAEINSLKNDIQIEQLQNLLKDVKAQQAKAEATAAGTTPGTTATTTLDPVTIEALVTQSQALLAQLETEIEARVGAGRPDLRKNTVTDATPSEELRDKLAYRNEIQSALEQAQLDDRHDLDGNALYRLQFKATVFPGQVKDKYGVARLTILPPLFENNHDVSKLYLDWLAYVTSQLNPSPDSQDTTKADRQRIKDRYSLLGPATGVYSVLPISYYKKKTAASPAADLTQGTEVEKAITKAFTDLNDALPANPNEQFAREFLVPVPPNIIPLTAHMAINPQLTDKYVSLFERARADLMSYMDGKSRFLRWRPDDNGQCLQLIGVTPENPDGKPYAELDGTSQGTVTQRIEALTAALFGNDTPPAAVAILVARSIHSLAPAYILAIQRTTAILEENGNQASAVVALKDYTKSLSRIVIAADSYLSALHTALLAPFRVKPDGGKPGSSKADLYDELLTIGTQEDIRKRLDKLSKDEPETFVQRSVLSEIEAAVPCLSMAEIASRIRVPDAFYDTVTAARGEHYATDGRRPYAGPSYAYSTAPVELAQRVSTVASATQAMDLMAAVSAIIPQAGVGVNAAGKLRQIASGHVDALESAPLIVGFSNNGAANVEAELFGAERMEPSFGWVFGPKVIIDAEKSQLALSQVLVQQPVTADISVPGWWRSLRLRVETVWAANFERGILAGAAFDGQSNAAPQPNERAADYVVDVPLQTNPATYEQLTEFIATKTWGLQYKRPVITSIEPQTLPACDKVTVLIAGADLWRGVQAYINGIAASNIKVMPDMQGLAATFDLAKMSTGSANLVVWTQLGKAPPASITIAPGGACAAKTADSTVNAAIQGARVLIPLAGNDLVFDIDQDAPLTNYAIVLRRPKHPNFSFNFATGIVRTGRTFVVTWPTDLVTKAFGANLPVPGEPFQVQLLRANPDGTTLVLSTLPTVHYYGKPIEQFLGDGIAVTPSEDKLSYTVVMKLPENFKAAFGETLSAKVTGLKDAAGKPVTAAADPVILGDNTASVTFRIALALPTGTAQPAVIELTIGAKKVSVAAPFNS